MSWLSGPEVGGRRGGCGALLLALLPDGREVPKSSSSWMRVIAASRICLTRLARSRWLSSGNKDSEVREGLLGGSTSPFSVNSFVSRGRPKLIRASRMRVNDASVGLLFLLIVNRPLSCCCFWLLLDECGCGTTTRLLALWYYGHTGKRTPSIFNLGTAALPKFRKLWKRGTVE